MKKAASGVKEGGAFTGMPTRHKVKSTHFRSDYKLSSPTFSEMPMGLVCKSLVAGRVTKRPAQAQFGHRSTAGVFFGSEDRLMSRFAPWKSVVRLAIMAAIGGFLFGCDEAM